MNEPYSNHSGPSSAFTSAYCKGSQPCPVGSSSHRSSRGSSNTMRYTLTYLKNSSLILYPPLPHPESIPAEGKCAYDAADKRGSVVVGHGGLIDNEGRRDKGLGTDEEAGKNRGKEANPLTRGTRLRTSGALTEWPAFMFVNSPRRSMQEA